MNGGISQQALPFKSERSIWVLSSLQISTDVLSALLGALDRQYPRVDFAITVPGSDQMSLSSISPGRPVSLPRESIRAWEKALTTMDTRVVLHIGALAPADRALARAALRRAAPLILLDPSLFGVQGRIVMRGGKSVPLEGPNDRIYVHDVDVAADVRAAGYPAESIANLPVDDLAVTADALAQAIREDMRRDQKLERGHAQPRRRFLESQLRHSFESGLVRRMARRRLVRYDSLEALREALGRPETILCLGNGPSSAESGLSEVAYDRLFRVNHMWADRGFLANADLVFTGGKGTVSRLGGGLYGLLSKESEARLLPYLLWRSIFQPIGYVTVDRLGLFFDDPKWQSIRPTNGASMIAVASALQPRRLVISGIDLFSHPDGT